LPIRPPRSFKYAAAAAATRCHKGNNPNGKNILSLAAAIALCTATINTGATAAYRRGRHWVSGHFRSDFGHDTFSLGERPSCIFAPSLEPWDWGGGWWAGYHYCGGWAYQYGYTPYTCYIFGGG
jgi:hypothetical protein